MVTTLSVNGKRPKRFAHRGRRLLVWLDRPLDGAFTVDVTYAGNPHPVRGPWGDVGWEELSEGVLVAGQPDGAASWYPVNDRPANKATYRISLTTDSPYIALANGQLQSRKVSAGHTTWVFDQPEPMASYLATIQIGRYGVTELTPPAPRKHVARRNHTAAAVEQAVFAPVRLAPRVAADFARHPELMACFVELFGPYPFASYSVVITDDPLEIPLEAQGMSIFGANHVDGRGGYDRLIAHELAHQWFGNSVTARTWRDIWLHEGFACYAEWLWSEASGGTSVKRLAARHHLRLTMLGHDLVLADPGPERMFDDRVYKRGALTLQAIRVTIGDERFFQLLRRWTDEHRHGSVETADFIALANDVAGTSLDDLFEAWLFRTKLPSLPSGRSRR